YLKSLENKAVQVETFNNLTAANFLQQENRKKLASLSCSQCPPPTTEEESLKELQKKLEEIDKATHSLKIKNNQLSVGTIIKREAMRKQINYKELSPSDIALVEPSLGKIGQVFKNHRDIEECYWNAKHYQRKASAKNEKMGYELVGLTTGETDRIMFKLDAKLVLIYNNNEYPVSCMEFAPYSGPKKIKTNRSKLLVEAKTLYNLTMGLNKNKENESLKIVNVQIMGKI
ncbi:hypothetical protein BD770DRAFT_325052, partial [Pilaira anomala]